MQRITPYLLYEDVAGALDWLAEAFGFREYGEKMSSPDGKIMHAAMVLDDSIIMMGCPGPDYKNPKGLGQVTQSLYIRVDDVDKHFEQARKAGATILQEPENMSYGDRRYGVADPEGHHWFFAQYVSVEAKAPPVYDEAALKAAREKLVKFEQRRWQLALMTDPLKVQEILSNEYGILLSVNEINMLLKHGQKGFSFGVIERWAAKQPLEALAWAASTLSWPNDRWDYHQLFLNAARKTLPDLDRDTLDGMLPEGPGKAKLLDLAEATTDPHSLASRILAVADPAERSSRLKLLAQGWSNPETSAKWARQNLSGPDKWAFYSQVGYNLAHRNPQAALLVLAELKGTNTYASTFIAMMRGLVQIGGMGQEAAELIFNSDFNARERADLVSELARRWVRQDADATIAWVDTLTAPEDVRAAIPLLVSQLDNDRVSRAVEAHFKSPDPVMEQALIEAAVPPGLYFDPQKSRLILDPLIHKDPGLKLQSGEGRGVNKEEMLWNSVNLTAQRQAEVGPPADAMEWLGTLPFASQRDYAKALGNVLTVWNLKDPTEAAEWLQKSTLDPTLKFELQKTMQP
jgi:PhnB protein